MAKSETSDCMVRGRSRWKCCRTGATVKVYGRAVRAVVASEDKENLTVSRAKVVRGVAREE